MCYFITIGVPTRHRQLVEALQKGRFRVDPAANPSVARLFPPDDALFTLTYGGCSCDLYAEPSSKRRPRADHPAKFCEAISTLVTAVGHVRLLAHSYSGDIDDEDVGPTAPLTLPLQDFLRQQGAFPVDTAVELVREAKVD